MRHKRTKQRLFSKSDIMSPGQRTNKAGKVKLQSILMTKAIGFVRLESAATGEYTAQGDKVYSVFTKIEEFLVKEGGEY